MTDAQARAKHAAVQFMTNPEKPIGHIAQQNFLAHIILSTYQDLEQENERLRTAMGDAIDIIEEMDGRDNSCDPPHTEELAEFRATLHHEPN